jgi:DNA-binding response OmpR family regulator
VVKAQLLTDEVTVSVRDTGIGLSAEDQLRVFDEFQQATQSKNPLITRPEGTGLGLTLARKFIELHGGRIWVESELGKGSTFTFALPVHAARSRPAKAGEVSPRVLGQGPTVLLIEDDPHAVELLSVYLRDAGFSVVVTEDAHAGLALAAELRPVAITLDILLPGSELDGWDLLGRLKSTAETADIPVIVVSIVDEPGKGFALGAADYLVKPLRREDLLATLDRLGISAGSRSAPASVLVIEADQRASQRMVEILSSVGYVVSETTSGVEGVRLALSNAPSLIVVDVLLPDVDGLAVAEALRVDPATVDTPILILTPRTMRPEDKAHLRDRVEYLAQGANFDRDVFLSLVRRLRPVALT